MKDLLKFLNVLINLLVKDSPFSVPLTLASALKTLGIYDNFTQFCVCSKCHSLYNIADCIENVGGSSSSKKCRFVQFPNHCQKRFRTPCGQLLMKEVKQSSGKTTLVPNKVFCYRSVIQSLADRLRMSKFLDLLNYGHEHRSADGVLTDIFDGKLWKEFQSTFGGNKNNPSLGFMLNVDWFNPFKHGNYSLGAMYFSILNLPRELRYKEQNTIQVGLIPGPKEPKLTLNSYLTPLIQELSQLETGVQFYSPDALGGKVIVKARLLATSCDIPASRKVCGFVGHCAIKACNKCLKDFNRKDDRTDYSGFDADSWPKRTNQEHRLRAQEYLKCTNKVERQRIESLHGLRYSVLLDLPYLDIIKHCAIDPMHNLFLGTSKHVMEVWQKENLITASDLVIIQERVNSMNPPPDIGRIPSKISSNFNDFTADEWKNWTIIYSIYALHDTLPASELKMWELFVKACSIVCCRVITEEDVKLVHRLLLEFNNCFERLHGPDYCTINMHLHCHLAETILNFGPIYSFWCFPYERYNGILGSYSTNNHVINVQVMRKFLLQQSLEKCLFDHDSSLQDMPKEWILSVIGSKLMKSTGSLKLQIFDATSYETILAQRHGHGDIRVSYSAHQKVKLCGKIYEGAFTDSQFEEMKQMYKLLYPNATTMQVSRLYIRCSDVETYSTNEHYSSSSSMSKRSHCAYGLNTSVFPNKKQLCSIECYIKNSVINLHSSKSEHILACVKWFQILPGEQQKSLGDTVDLWSTFQTNQPTYISLYQIQCKAATVKTVAIIDGIEQNVILSAPVHRMVNH